MGTPVPDFAASSSLSVALTRDEAPKLIAEGRRDPYAAGEPLDLPASHRSVALVGTYPPTTCGLATFTSNLRTATAANADGWTASVVRVLDLWEPAPRQHVVAQWLRGDPASLQRSVDALNSVDVVLLQHEYGLFGGPDGEDVLSLLREVETPTVVVLHTALEHPSAHQQQVLDGILDATVVAVVQSAAARDRIIRVHGANPARIVVIPHGAAQNLGGPRLSDVRRPSILTWGLLSPGKGIEHGIAATAEMRGRAPSPSYIVAGQTHPKVRAAQGEAYRERLMDLAGTLGVAERVIFDDVYRDWESLRALVRSVDVVLLPYDSHDQVSSGVLVEAIASSKPVVATRFPHAEELLADGAGLLVDHGDVEAMARSLERVLHEPGVAERMAFAARRAATPLLWPAVGASYRRLIDRVLAERAVA
jgi:polysaccharide biosynthesis protein PslF